VAASLAVVALGVAAPPGASGDAKAYFFVAGHVFGVGEQQVYLVDRETQLTVRYRNANGELVAKTFHQHAQNSVAWTIEGIASGGGPVLAVATAAPTPAPSGSPSPTPSPSPAAAPSPASPPPSPALDAQGAVAVSGPMIEVAPASIVLSGITSELPQLGRPWKSAGNLQLPYGQLTVDLDNVITSGAGNQDTYVAQIASTGKTDLAAKIKVPGFGGASLRGTGTSTSTSFIETQSKLLLGLSLAATSHGNATAKDQHGSYDLAVKIAIKLVRYVPGIPPYNGGPGFVVASGYLGGTTAPDTGLYATAHPDTIAIPAATDTGFIPPPAPPATPYASALPATALPDIPLPMASDEPQASPPAGPTPTPQPTHY
jgi:hypothetical protein